MNINNQIGCRPQIEMVKIEQVPTCIIFQSPSNQIMEERNTQGSSVQAIKSIPVVAIPYLRTEVVTLAGPQRYSEANERPTTKLSNCCFDSFCSQSAIAQEREILCCAGMAIGVFWVSMSGGSGISMPFMAGAIGAFGGITSSLYYQTKEHEHSTPGILICLRRT